MKKDECGFYNFNGKVFMMNSKNRRHVFICRGVEKIRYLFIINSNLVSIAILTSVVKIWANAFESYYRMKK